MNRRHGTEDEARDERDRDRERERRSIHLHLRQTRQHTVAHETHADEEVVREHEPDDTGHEAEHDALREQLPDESSAAGTKGSSDRHLTAPRRGAREQQARDVAAGDEQHEADGSEQDEQYGPYATDDDVAIGRQREMP